MGLCICAKCLLQVKGIFYFGIFICGGILTSTFGCVGCSWDVTWRFCLSDNRWEARSTTSANRCKGKQHKSKWSKVCSRGRESVEFQGKFPLCMSVWGPMGMAFSWRGCSLQTIPPVGRRSPLLRTCAILWENRGGSVGSTFYSGLMCCRFESHLRNWTFRLSPHTSAPRLGNQRPWYVQPRLCDWAYKRSLAT